MAAKIENRFAEDAFAESPLSQNLPSCRSMVILGPVPFTAGWPTIWQGHIYAIALANAYATQKNELNRRRSFWSNEPSLN